MRRTAIALSLLSIVLVTSCDENNDPNLFCHAVLEFPDDNTRIAFIERNAARIVQQIPSFYLRSHPTRPEIHLIADMDACPSNSRAFGLLGFESAVRSTTVRTREELWTEPLIDTPPYIEWDQNDARQCVGIVNKAPDDEGQFMVDFIMSGLRDGEIYGDESSYYFSADESCHLVESVARASMATNRGSFGNLRFCPNASHAACGDPNIFSVGPLPPDWHLDNNSGNEGTP